MTLLGVGIGGKWDRVKSKLGNCGSGTFAALYIEDILLRSSKEAKIFLAERSDQVCLEPYAVAPEPFSGVIGEFRSASWGLQIP